MSGRVVECPACGKSASAEPDNAWRPFCCERCKQGDLGRWFSNRYVIPDDDGSPPPDEAPTQ